MLLKGGIFTVTLVTSSLLQSPQDRYFGVVPRERPCPFQALRQRQGDAFPFQEGRRRTQPLPE